MSEVKIYRVREGVEWVNGVRVPDDRIVRLTDAEAEFDRMNARLLPHVEAAPIEETAPEAIEQQPRGNKRSVRRGRV